MAAPGLGWVAATGGLPRRAADSDSDARDSGSCMSLLRAPSRISDDIGKSEKRRRAAIFTASGASGHAGGTVDLSGQLSLATPGAPLYRKPHKKDHPQFQQPWQQASGAAAKDNAARILSGIHQAPTGRGSGPRPPARAGRGGPSRQGHSSAHRFHYSSIMKISLDHDRDSQTMRLRRL
jgi:hypothetical protein